MQTVLEAFERHASERPHAPCWQYKDPTGQWRTLTWGEACRRVHAAAQWLIERGLKAGDRVALWSATRVEWTLWDLAILSAGGVSVPIYQNLLPQQATFIIHEPQCRFLVLERAYQPDLLATVERACPHLEGVILLEGAGATERLPLWKNGELLNIAADGAKCVAERSAAVRADMLATIVYTSGTTGTPKGVELTHANFFAEVEGLRQVLPFSTPHIGLMFLPLAHIVARAMQMYQIVQGCVAAYAESIEKVPQNLMEVRPHFFAAVPRLFEKMRQRVDEQLSAGPAWKRIFFDWALRIGEQVGRRRRLRQSVPIGLRCLYPLAKFAFRPLQQKLGGRLLCAISGGAPLAEEIAKFFFATGLTVLEGYGLTETTAAVTINRLDDLHFGTVGKPLQGVQVRMAEDNEILVKGPIVMRGYYQRPEETAAVLDGDGWFATGDIGEFSRDGFLRITDRKKDLIKTSGGKYIAPQSIEALFKTSPYINDVIVHGDRQKFLTALITLHRDAVEQFLRREAVAPANWREVTQHPKVRGLVQQIVEEKNRQLASFETIKRFTILDHDFSLEGGQLTPTLKVKRQAAYEKYKTLFEAMYKE